MNNMNIQTLYYDRATGTYYRVIPYGNPPAQTPAQAQVPVQVQTPAQVQNPTQLGANRYAVHTNTGQLPSVTGQIPQPGSVIVNTGDNSGYELPPSSAEMQTEFRQSNISPSELQVINAQTLQQPAQQSIEDIMGEWLAPPFMDGGNNNGK